MNTAAYVFLKLGKDWDGHGFHAWTSARFMEEARRCTDLYGVRISLFKPIETWVGGKAVSIGSYVRFPTIDLMVLMTAELYPGARAILKFEGDGIVDAVKAMRLFFTETVFTGSTYTVLDASEVPDGISEAVHIDDFEKGDDSWML